MGLFIQLAICMHQLESLQRTNKMLLMNLLTTWTTWKTNIQLITGGNFNFIWKPRLDKLDNMPEHHDNRNYREGIISYLEVNNLVDAWRAVNPDMKFFTWHRGNKRSRLDYFYCSDHLLNCIENVSILPGVQSDHSLLKRTLKSGNDQIKEGASGNLTPASCMIMYT